MDSVSWIKNALPFFSPPEGIEGTFFISISFSNSHNETKLGPSITEKILQINLTYSFYYANRTPRLM